MVRPPPVVVHDWGPVGSPVRVAEAVPGALACIVADTPAMVAVIVVDPDPDRVTLTAARPPPEVDREVFMAVMPLAGATGWGAAGAWVCTGSGAGAGACGWAVVRSGSGSGACGWVCAGGSGSASAVSGVGVGLSVSSD